MSLIDRFFNCKAGSCSEYFYNNVNQFDVAFGEHKLEVTIVNPQRSSGGGSVVACPETQQQRRAQPTTTPTAAASRQFSHHSSGPIRAEIGDHVTWL